MKNLCFLFFCFTLIWNVQAQAPKIDSINNIKTDFYKDHIVARQKWYGNDKKLDRLKTYYKSGELNEVFNYTKGVYNGTSYQFNKKGVKTTTWEFNNGKLVKRTDHIIEFNKKTEEKVKKAHADLLELNQNLKLNPNDFRSTFKRANIRRYLGNNTLALIDFKKIERHILKLSKTKEIPEKMLANIYDNLASIYSEYEMPNHTIHYKLKALKASPTESRLYHNLGSYLVSVKSYRLGLVYLNKAIDMVPSHSFAHWISAVAYTELEDYDKAMIYVNIAFKNEASLYKRGSGKSERDLNTVRGLLYHKLGDSDKGIEDLEEALNINKDNSFALRNLGTIYYDLGEYALACEYLQSAKSLGYEKTHDKDDLQAYLELSCENAVIDEDITEIIELKSIETHKITDKAYVYPNPTKGDITIKNLPFKDYHYLIFDYTRKLVFQGDSQKTPINMSHLPNGVYIIKANKNNLSDTFRVIKE